MDFEYRCVQWQIPELNKLDGPAHGKVIADADQSAMADGFKLVGMQDHGDVRARHYARLKPEQIKTAEPAKYKRAEQTSDLS